MFKYIGILLLLNIVLGDVDYKYDDYVEADEGVPSREDEEVYSNETLTTEPSKVDIRSNLIEGTAGSPENSSSKIESHEEVRTSPVPTRKLHSKRECNFTSRLLPKDSPAPDPLDSITTYPFAASVLRMGSHYASGALVDKRWVLTAGGVFYNVRESIKLYRVRLGSVNCKKGGTLLAVQQVSVHPGYTPGKPELDLALLRLSQPADLSAQVHPVSLTETKGTLEIGKFLTVYWPRLIVNGKPLPATAKERKQHTNLRVSTQRVIPWKQCMRAMSTRRQGLSQDNFCLRPLKQHHTICLPDVGAPVVSQDGLWGIVSGWVGEPCSFADPSPVVVVRISPPTVRYWLDSQMEQED